MSSGLKVLLVCIAGAVGAALCAGMHGLPFGRESFVGDWRSYNPSNSDRRFDLAVEVLASGRFIGRFMAIDSSFQNSALAPLLGSVEGSWVYKSGSIYFKINDGSSVGAFVAWGNPPGEWTSLPVLYLDDRRVQLAVSEDRYIEFRKTSP
jgi:hypothetical protein